MKKTTYMTYMKKKNRVSASLILPDCSRFCRNVCTRLFLFGRNQCIADCLNCAGFVGQTQSQTKKSSIKTKSKSKCRCK